MRNAVSVVMATMIVALVACGPNDAIVQDRVDSVLAANDMAWAAGAVEKGQVTLSGQAPSEEAMASVAPLVIQIPGVKGVTDQIALDTVLIRKRDQLAECRSGIDAALSSGPIAFSGTTLQRSARAILDMIGGTLASCPDAAVEVAGHTDSSGSDAANQQVSERRAQAVVQYLVGRGVPVERLTAVGYGETRPIADNGTPAGREANRRVEFVLSH
ncbi:MAG: OmpA family protein [Gemmatimonadota bacterium]